MSNQAPYIRMVLFRVWTEGGRQQKTPGAEALGVLKVKTYFDTKCTRHCPFIKRFTFL